MSSNKKVEAPARRRQDSSGEEEASTDAGKEKTIELTMKI